MRCKCSILASLLFGTGSFLAGAEAIPLPDGIGMIQPPQGWQSSTSPNLILRGLDKDAANAPRWAFTLASGDATTTAASLRDGWRRVTDGCEMIDDDDEPIGGRVWRRIRVRFAVGPLAFSQCAWIGTVNGRTLVAVLSAPDDQLAHHLAAASTALASISVRR